RISQIRLNQRQAAPESYTDSPCFQKLGNAFGTCGISRPERGIQTELAVISEVYGFFGITHRVRFDERGIQVRTAPATRKDLRTAFRASSTCPDTLSACARG